MPVATQSPLRRSLETSDVAGRCRPGPVRRGIHSNSHSSGVGDLTSSRTSTYSAPIGRDVIVTHYSEDLSDPPADNGTILITSGAPLVHRNVDCPHLRTSAPSDHDLNVN